MNCVFSFVERRLTTGKDQLLEQRHDWFDDVEQVVIEMGTFIRWVLLLGSL